MILIEKVAEYRVLIKFYTFEFLKKHLMLNGLNRSECNETNEGVDLYSLILLLAKVRKNFCGLITFVIFLHQQIRYIPQKYRVSLI